LEVRDRFSFMDLASFLRDNQEIMAPIIEWGGAILLTVIVLSPFLIIRHRMFRPTRWWYVVGAYFLSFTILTITVYLRELVNESLIRNYLNSFELSGGYRSAFLKHHLWLLFLYPTSVFFSVKLMYGFFTKKRFFVTLAIATVFVVLLWAIAYNIFVYNLGQVLMNLS
jgi:hypothetical protein